MYYVRNVLIYKKLKVLSSTTMLKYLVTAPGTNQAIHYFPEKLKAGKFMPTFKLDVTKN